MTAAGESARLGPRPDGSGVPVRYEKADTILRIALDMQGTAEGLSLEDIQRNYSDKPLSRRTAERLRDAIERVFPQMLQANPGELPKRWRLPVGTVSGFAAVSAEELADLAAGVSLLRRENMLVQAENAERAVSKLRALMRPDALTGWRPIWRHLRRQKGIAMRPGPRPKIDPEIVAALRQAILASRKVKFTTSTAAPARPASTESTPTASSMATGIISWHGAKTNRRVIFGISRCQTSIGSNCWSALHPAARLLAQGICRTIVRCFPGRAVRC